ncbi:MAG: fused MFS/spermidine synthase [Nitrospinales bacterium]
MAIFLFQAVVFLSAFLIFQIELILGKIILPGFGGGYLVWGISMVLYQGLLFFGYLYVHLLNRWFNFAVYRKWQCGFLLVSLAFLPLNVERLKAPTYAYPPVIEIIFMLSMTVGFLFFLLASLSVYTQIQLTQSSLPEKRNPYFLFASSNFGAFAALLSYPFLIEPNFDLSEQLLQWEVLYVALVLLFLTLQWKCPPEKDEEVTSKELTIPDRSKMAQWLLLSAAASAMFLAVTNELTFNIAPVPLLWILPLALYLLTFVLAFKKNPFCPKWIQDRFYILMSMGILLFLFNWMDNSILSFLVMVMLRYQLSMYTLGVIVEPVILLVICFGFCLVCHFKLNESRPESSSDLTTFYLALSIGGFLGGALVNWIVPLVFDGTLEFLLSFLLATGALASSKKPMHRIGFILWLVIFTGLIVLWPLAVNHFGLSSKNIFALVFTTILFVFMYFLQDRPRQTFVVLTVLILILPLMEGLKKNQNRVYKQRNYYGIYEVFDTNNYRHFIHGSTEHGAQSLDLADKRKALTYFHHQSPVGEFLDNNPLQLSNFALIGLGAGSLAVYAGPNDTYDYYELDPLVGEIAQKYFTFIKDSRGKINIFYGDARVSLRKAEENVYETMVIDVFNSGSIPVHLITVEAIKEYQRTMKEEGVLFFHVTNEFLDLVPVISANANAIGLKASIKQSHLSNPPEQSPTVWMALSKEGTASNILINSFGWVPVKAGSTAPWTDRYSSIFSALD